MLTFLCKNIITIRIRILNKYFKFFKQIQLQSNLINSFNNLLNLILFCGIYGYLLLSSSKFII